MTIEKLATNLELVLQTSAGAQALAVELVHVPGHGAQIKAMLHEAIFLATCLATNVARQVARKISRVTPPATATKCCVASCKKSRNILTVNLRHA